MNRSLIVVVACVVLVLSIACGGDDKDAEKPDESAGGNSSSSGRSGEGGSDENSSVADKLATCGNNQLDAREECDDGNDDDEDGCTSLCQFTCKTDADCEDLDPCDGEERCTEDHICVPVADVMSDGEPCGANASCYDGECVEHLCGDGITQGDEQCDDGNDEDGDGCTKECLFTCEPSSYDESVINDCNPTAVCNEETHMWEGGDPLPDGTVCNRQQGYCEDGVCVLAICGDGVQEPNEECDLGEQNGVPNSGCLENCRLTVCGNGIIEGSEMCDDGNNTNMDGCDYRCLAEVTYRGTTMQLTLDPAPDYCVYAGNENEGNLFRKLFSSQLLVDLVNMVLGGMFTDGSIQALFHVMDLESFDLTKPDPVARLGLSMGEPLVDWASTFVKLDMEYNSYREYFDEDLNPLTTVLGETVTEDRLVVRSTVPTVAGFDILGDKFVLHDMMARIETDDNLTPLLPPPETVEGLEAPSSVGNNGGLPTGVLCGALKQEVFAAMPLPAEILVLCLDQLAAGTFTPCEEGMDPRDGECDSILTWFQKGCTDLTIPLLNPLGDPDVDSDGDGVNDAYTMVLYVSAERVKVIGVMDRPEEPEE
ncbi:MAG: DUF4215 domain-containing protein [Deltaproteobacteria bacterium]|nr:DUF4215 domain-containing protein [Deltaproteobacteria bacterium]